MLPFWKFLGFAVYVVIYLLACDGLHRWTKETLKEASLKVLPIFQCILTILSSKSDEPGFTRYSRRLTAGLLLCLIGDFLVVWKDYKIYGAVFFMGAHTCYILAFRMRPYWGGPTLASFLLVAASGAAIVVPAMDTPLVPRLLVCVYLGLVCCMGWRAWVRWRLTRSLTGLCAALGALVFIASDTTLMVDRFVFKEAWQHAPLAVMLTYYSAQFGLALSATDDFTPTYYDYDEEREKTE